MERLGWTREANAAKISDYAHVGISRVVQKFVTTALLSASLLAISACAKATVSAEGADTVKFGMTTAELSAQGFVCETPTTCERNAESYVGPLDAPAAREPISVRVELSDGVVTEISETYDNQTEDGMIAAYTEKYGDPKRCPYRNVLGAEIEFFVWKSKSGSTVSLARIADYGVAPNLSSLSGSLVTIDYRDPIRANAFWSERCSGWS